MFLIEVPKLVEELDPSNNLDPSKIHAYSRKKLTWKCKKNHIWQAATYSRVRGNGCPYCYGWRTPKEKSLLFLFPELAAEYSKKNKINVDEIGPGSHKKVWWTCSRGHEWQAVVYSRSRGNGCPYCASKIATPTYSFSYLFPELLKEWDYDKNIVIDPTKTLPGSNKIVYWKCEKGHEWQSDICRRSNGASCPFCFWIKRGKTRKETIVPIETDKENDE
ncbi:MAG: zinc-ribbon domain-containing protein [Nanoarchaeota archaeon]